MERHASTRSVRRSEGQRLVRGPGRKLRRSTGPEDRRVQALRGRFRDATRTTSSSTRRGRCGSRATGTAASSASTPPTGKLTNYMMPDPSVRDPHTMIFDGNGDAWFTAQGAGAVGKLTTATGKIRLWKMESRLAPVRDRRRLEESSVVRPVRHEQDRHDRSRVGEFKAYTLPNDSRASASHRRHEGRRDLVRRLHARLPRPARSEERTDRGVRAAGRSGLAAVRRDIGRPRPHLARRDGHRSPTASSRSIRRQRKFTETIVITADQANTIRHMTFDKSSRQIWFGGDANMIGRVAVSPAPLVP